MAIQLILRSSEVKLMELANALRDPTGWQAVHFHLNSLLEQYKSEYQVKIAVNLINDLLKTYEGSLCLMSDHSIVVMCQNLEKVVLNKLIFQLRYLYMDDPLAYTEDGHENSQFCTTYNLSRQWQEFYDVCTRYMALSVRKISPSERAVEREAPPPRAMPSGPMLESVPAPAVSKGPLLTSSGSLISRIAGIERDLRLADISKVIRKQPVCTALPNTSVRRVFDEMYIHIAHLRQMLKSDIDLLGNRWLFKYLTQILDERVLEMIRQSPARYLDSPVSLNLNVETLLSSAFAEFDAAVKPAMKVSIVIEIPVVDVFADINAFMIAKQDAQKQGYRVCLDGLTTKSFINISREKLGLDLIKVQWNADVEGDLQSRDNRDFLEAVQHCGTNRVVLCRCDNKQAVTYGQALGISLFQGRYLDSILNPTMLVAN